MTLLSPLALWFAMFAMVPLILHLYQRRRRNVILFSTNQFFTKSVIRSQRSLRLRHLLLLLMRIAVCALLALALSRPIMTWLGMGVERGRRDLVIVLDDSLSMQARDSAGRTGFERARDHALEALYALKSGDRAAVVTFSGRGFGRETRAGLAMSQTLALLIDQVRTLEPTAAAGDAHQALARAARMFEQLEQRSRSLLLITDAQESDWRGIDWPQPTIPVGALMITTAPPTRDNALIDQVVLSQTASVVGQPNLLRVKLSNHRSQKVSADLVVNVDDKPVARRPVELLGRSPRIEQVPLVFDAAGEHRVTIELADRDALPIDNRYYMAVNVKPRLPTLLVDGGGGRGRQRGGGFFLRVAMSVVGEDGDQVHVEHVTPNELPQQPLADYRVVLLHNVRHLPLSQVDRLEKFVRDGGGLGVFLGDQTDPAFHNDVLGGETRPLGGLMPATIDQVVRTGQVQAPLHLVEAELEHPILQRFQGTLRSALGGVEVYQTWQVSPRKAWVIARLSRQLPLMVERSYGRGRVILMTTSPQPDWTNLPVRRVFIPLINRTVSYLAGAGPVDVGNEIGRELTLLRGGWDYDRPLNVRLPDDRIPARASVKVLGAEPVAYLPGDRVSAAGFYQLADHDQQARTLWSVNAPRSEAQPGVIDLDAVPQHAGNWQVRRVDAGAQVGDELVRLLDEEHGGREVWSTLLWIALIMVLLEPLVADWTMRWFSRGEPNAAEATT